MLLELKVSNFAIIENLQIVFRDGLNILSGETGAGKSILLKSLALLMGEKSSAETVRSGQEQANVEGSFDLSERPDLIAILEAHGIDCPENMLVVRRLISSQGKNRIYINGSLNTLHVLQSIVSPLVEVTGPAAPLIEMTGQHENRSLISRHYHLDLLDMFAGATPLRNDYSKIYRRHSEIQKEITQLTEATRDRAQRLDFLRFQRDEIQNVALQPGEDERLESDFAKARHATKLAEFASFVDIALGGESDSALARVTKVLQRAVDFRQLDPTLDKKLEPLAQAKILLEEVVYTFNSYSDSLNDSELNVAEIEERMASLRRLQKKFGASVEDILTELTRIQDEILKLENFDENLLTLEKEREEIEKQMRTQAQALHKKRIATSKTLAERVNKQLADLNMKGVIFTVQIQDRTEFSATGLSDVEFMIQSSSKDAPRAIAKFASGGELSRILLSLKNVVGVSELPRTYLFDEVDTGVSGPTAEKVGRKLHAIAKGQQVICVTHLPQVASYGDSHFLIQKGAGKSGVQMDVSELPPKERIREIARLISGEKITKTSLDHAAHLLKEAHG